MHHDEKYVVFKREEFLAWAETVTEIMPGGALEDAVVIRTQDVFAAAGLEAYANNIRVYAGAIAGMIPDLPAEKRGPAMVMVQRCTEIAGYFQDCAAEAEDRLQRGDVKVPD